MDAVLQYLNGERTSSVKVYQHTLPDMDMIFFPFKFFFCLQEVRSVRFRGEVYFKSAFAQTAKEGWTKAVHAK